MPIQPNPTRLIMWPHQVDVPVPDGTGMFISMTIASDGTATDQMLDDTLQDLLDYMQAWPGRRPDQDAVGKKYIVDLYAVTTNDPIDPPPPPDALQGA